MVDLPHEKLEHYVGLVRKFNATALVQVLMNMPYVYALGVSPMCMPYVYALGTCPMYMP